MSVVQAVKLDRADRSAQASLVILMTGGSVAAKPSRRKPDAAKVCQATRLDLAVLSGGTVQRSTSLSTPASLD